MSRNNHNVHHSGGEHSTSVRRAAYERAMEVVADRPGVAASVTAEQREEFRAHEEGCLIGRKEER